MFTLPVAAGEAVADGGVAPGDPSGAGAEPAAGDVLGAAAAGAGPCEWVIFGKMSQ